MQKRPASTKASRAKDADTESKAGSMRKVNLALSLPCYTDSNTIAQQIFSEYFDDPAGADAKRLRALKKAVPSVEAHDTISRAWSLRQRNVRQERQEALKAKYEGIREAMDALERVSPKLFASAKERSPSLAGLANTPEGKDASRRGRIQGLFPRQMRVPTDTLGDGFDESWKREG